MTIKIQIEVDSVGELTSLISYRDDERDAFRDELHRLLATPLRFSLPELAGNVLKNINSLTPDQSQKIRKLIETEGKDLGGATP